MAQAQKTEIWDYPATAIYDVIVDYNSYPKFVEGMDEVSILEGDESGARVSYQLTVIKKVNYTVKLTHDRPNGTSWVLEGGDLFKVNQGFWKLNDLGDGRTEVTFSLEVDIKGFVPKSIINRLTTKNLPKMMQSFHDRVVEVSK